ncbi:ABC-2 transporter permease [Lentibacillus sp. L22]|uniref:ABC-2 transporter permease n=1 Tax=Lentibacillus TaxID=175304 RepID=UPI0022B0C4E4|nr:ABC-2 transporter permease [Lentibacillus daqui]
MLQLIKKDLAIHKFLWIIYFAMLIFFIAFDKDAIFIITLISAYLMMDAFYADEQANGHRLWNALPFTRSEVVSSRYAGLLVITFICSSAVMVLELIFKAGWNMSLWKEVVGSVVLMMFLGALCFPVFYWISKQKVIFTLLILYVLLHIAGSYAFYYLYLYLLDTRIVPQVLSNGQLFGSGFVIAICLYLLSWRLSITIYKRREII